MSTHPPTVQLRHELPDGSAHVDWMLGQDAAGEEPLITFRVPRRVDELELGETMPAERIGEHRPAYLTYEGTLSGGRGTVARLCRGRITAQEISSKRRILEISWEHHEAKQRFEIVRDDSGHWTVRRDT